MIYVVRRSFRNFNQMMVPGSVVEPGSIKHFKNRLRDRYIIQVNEHELDKWQKYFITKYGYGMKMPESKKDDESKKEPEQKPAPVKVVVKAN